MSTRRVLVAYATRYGSTEEVARAVAETLGQKGLTAEVEAAKNVRSLDGYDAVVLGAALFVGSPHKDARKFLDRHQKALQARPVAVFAMGPISADDLEATREQLAKALGKLPWLQPIATEVFVGAYDPSRLARADKMLAALPASPLHGVPAQDGRDWDAIRSWATGLAERLAGSD